MKKRLTKILSVILAVVAVFSFHSVAFAEEETTPETEIIIEEYTTIGGTSSGITISGVTATCAASLTAKKSTSLKIKMELQKKKSGSYETIKTWTATKTGTTLVTEQKKTINVLSTYRLKTTFTAGSESTTVYTYPK